jgi:hypothetical protein
LPESLVENQTAPVRQQLLFADPPGSTPLPFPLTGAAVVLEMRDINGALVDTSGDVAVTDVALGKVSYTPDAADFVSTKGQYYARWKVTISGQVQFFPSAEPDTWTVRL